MSNSYRIRTDIGKDKSIKVLLDQDFEFLEILSLKILQSQIYTRPCADYGVVVGRVSVNNGFGLPNAKVSVFIPIDQVDSENEVKSILYPYTNTNDLNEDGYRYNLLPYKQQHGGHTPTGTFFTREDVLTEPALYEIFDKYYKYTARTNDSGDYMIFGVPVGPQTIHLDVDLSDIGEFSLSPQDLVRMGRANESQVAGTKFKSSTNLNELPQIVSINKTIEIEPLWGQPDICSLGITRTDFDLTEGLNIKIEPTAIFMGSLISNKDDFTQKRNCKPKNKLGQLCSMTTGPGEIIAIRQTIRQDLQGRPGLEVFDLDSGGQVIDENGTWMLDVPMNLDYVITNEFGQQVLSDDPSKGIPTKGKYRFKVKWNQPPTMRQPVKRGYFLVPNVREYGWTNPSTPPSYNVQKKSYAFSLDWNDYFDPQSAINCEDTFYMMQYNKVYTVAQHITQYRKGFQRPKYISVKNILDDSCESENNRFPTNDAQFRFDLLFLLARIVMPIFKYIIIYIVIIAHILAQFLKLVGPILGVIIYFFCRVWGVICNTINTAINLIKKILNKIGLGGNIQNISCPSQQNCQSQQDAAENLWRNFTLLTVPSLTYPDCELCDCGDDQQTSAAFNPATDPGAQVPNINPGSSIISQFYYTESYQDIPLLPYQYMTDPNLAVVASIMSGDKVPHWSGTLGSARAPQPSVYDVGGPGGRQAIMWTTSINMAERFNLFNTKAKFFDNNSNNPGGGVNQIKAQFNYPSAGSINTNFHYDNIIAISVQSTYLSTFGAGQIVTFQDPNLSSDPNLTGVTSFNQFNTESITGTTVGTISPNGQTTIIPNVSVTSASPNGGSQTAIYTLTGNTSDSSYLKFPTDLEYFQVITATTITNYLSTSNPAPFVDSFKQRVLQNNMYFNMSDIKREFYSSVGVYNNIQYNPLQLFTNSNNEVLVFLVRGVDPHTTRQPCKYDLSKIYGYNGFGNVVITGNYKLNIPIQPGSFRPANHSNISGNLTNNTDPSTGLRLFYPSYQFQPALTGLGSFTGYTTNMVQYYSSLGSSCSYQPNPGPTGSLGQASNCGVAPFGTSVLTGLINIGPSPYFNGFNNQFTSVTPKNPAQNCYNSPPIFFVNSGQITPNGTSNSSQRNSGYYNNEVVEGGSFMVQSIPLVQIILPNTCNEWDLKGYYYSSDYAGTSISFQTNNLGILNRQIVMRSDRLPTSSTFQNLDGASMALMQNSNLSTFNIDDAGTSSTTGGGGGDNFQNPQDDIPAYAQVFASFTCDGLVPLECYGVDNNGNPIVQPTGDKCYTNGVTKGPSEGQLAKIMKGGCYILVTAPIRSLKKDIELILEWSSRLLIMFGACRNVWSHLFTNNWINGTLFAFPVNNDRFFTGVNVSPSNPVTIDGVTYTKPNFPYTKYCTDTIFFDRDTNNFFYRSCPYVTGSTNLFVGAPVPPTNISNPSNYGGNKRNILFPTTMVDLGPRDIYLQELVMSDDYDGYVVNKLNSTTYNDVEDIFNLLIINRISNLRFVGLLRTKGNKNILRFFSRDQVGAGLIHYRMSDADYSQAISINSELGVAAFDPANYTSAGQIFFNGGDTDDSIFGIQFSSDTQLRDWITPKRTIINPNLPVTNQCAFNNFGEYSQEVPFYNWTIKTNASTNPGPPLPNSIWGSQKNEWATLPNIEPTTNEAINEGFLKYRYQSMDRLIANCRYFRPQNTSQTNYFKGYIYGVDGSGNLSPSITNWQTNTPVSDAVTVGAPFHFYFGLKQGASAWDRFAKKWVGFETIEN